MLITGRQGLALVRIVLGVLLLVSAVGKIQQGWLANGEAMSKTIQQSLERSEVFYRPFLEGTVLPNAATFSQLVTLGEIVAGTSLLLGLLTRVGAVVCMWLMLNYMLMKGTLLGQYTNGMTYSDRVYFLGGLACFLAAAGLSWGLDRFLGRWLADVPVVGWLLGYPMRASRVTGPAAVTEPIPMPERRAEPPVRRAA
jgi:uncharacterized membrane protein YphA (DoxX/SURF4 family)